jgi:polar amino acid transport system substrate-binding protein
MITSWLRRNVNSEACLSNWLLVLSLCFSVNSFGQGIRFVGEETMPLLYENSQHKKDGALLELALALSTYTGLESTVETMPWARAYETALQEPNVVLIAVLKTPQRERELQWIGKVLQAQAHLIALKERTDINITAIEQAKKYVLASVRGYGSAKYLLRQGFSEKHNLVLTSQPSQIWGLLYNKRVDLVLSNLNIGRFEAKFIGLEPSLMQSKMQIQELVSELQFATGLATPLATVLTLQKGLIALKNNGSYDAILKKWNLK